VKVNEGDTGEGTAFRGTGAFTEGADGAAIESRFAISISSVAATEAVPSNRRIAYIPGVKEPLGVQ
jgi:hypothetical protein